MSIHRDSFKYKLSLEQDTREGYPYILCTIYFYLLYVFIFFIEYSAQIALEMSDSLLMSFDKNG
jgi:hypothetical protein